MQHTKMKRKLIDGAHNLQVKSQIKIQNMLNREYKLEEKLQIMQWCPYDPGFKPNEMDHGFVSWIPKGVTKFDLLSEKGKL